MKKFSLLGDVTPSGGASTKQYAGYYRFTNAVSGGGAQIALLVELHPIAGTLPLITTIYNVAGSYAYGPKVSPDQTKAVYVAGDVGTPFNQHLWVYDIAARTNTKIVNDSSPTSTSVYDIAWHPDSSKILFTVNSNQRILRTINADGTGLTTLFSLGSGSSPQFGYPKYNFDGTKIAYTRRNGSSNLDLRVCNADGSSDGIIKTDASLANVAIDFSWANLSNVIAFVNAGATASGCVKKINSDGTGETTLTTLASNWGTYISSNAWSMDDTKIFHVKGSTLQVYRIFSDGSGEAALSPSIFTINPGNKISAVAVFSDDRLYINKYVAAGVHSTMVTVALDGSDEKQFDDDVNADLYGIEARWG